MKIPTERGKLKPHKFPQSPKPGTSEIKKYPEGPSCSPGLPGVLVRVQLNFSQFEPQELAASGGRAVAVSLGTGSPVAGSPEVFERSGTAGGFAAAASCWAASWVVRASRLDTGALAASSAFLGTSCLDPVRLAFHTDFEASFAFRASEAEEPERPPQHLFPE